MYPCNQIEVAHYNMKTGRCKSIKTHNHSRIMWNHKQGKQTKKRYPHSIGNQIDSHIQHNTRLYKVQYISRKINFSWNIQCNPKGPKKLIFNKK